MSEQRSGALAQLSDEMANAVERAARSVVRVSGRQRMPASGIVWSADGAIVTADHVIEKEEEITIGLPDGREVPATIAGRDPGTDIAVLNVAEMGLTAIGRTDQARVGTLVLAVARPGEAHAASLGVVSAIGGSARSSRGGVLDGFIRTDATPYPGFSGGALIDVSGNAIGLSTSHFGQGAGFAIPIASVATIVEALQKGGRVKRGYLGVSSQAVALPAAIRERAKLEQETALLLIGVESGGPADRAGLILGDLLVSIGGAALRDTDDLQSALRRATVDQSTAVRVLRGGELREVPVTVGERR